VVSDDGTLERIRAIWEHEVTTDGPGGDVDEHLRSGKGSVAWLVDDDEHNSQAGGGAQVTPAMGSRVVERRRPNAAGRMPAALTSKATGARSKGLCPFAACNRARAARCQMNVHFRRWLRTAALTCTTLRGAPAQALGLPARWSRRRERTRTRTL